MRNKSRKRINHELRVENERLKSEMSFCKKELYRTEYIPFETVSVSKLIPRFHEECDIKYELDRMYKDVSNKVFEKMAEKIKENVNIRKTEMLDGVRYDMRISYAIKVE